MTKHYEWYLIASAMRTTEFIEKKTRELEGLCRSQGIALTVQRRSVLEALAARTDHPTADQVYDAVKGVVKGVSRTTVYRVLEALVQLGVVVKVSSPRARARFDANVVRHHHLICLGCDAVADCHDERLSGLDLPRIDQDGFAMKDYSLTITGYCAACSGNKDPSITHKGGKDEEMALHDLRLHTRGGAPS